MRDRPASHPIMCLSITASAMNSWPCCARKWKRAIAAHQQKKTARPSSTRRRKCGLQVCSPMPGKRAKPSLIELLPLTERTRLMPPALVMEPTPDSAIMREEIFGPLLPVISYRLLDDAITHVLEHDRPLALYCFSDNTAEIDMMLGRIIAGGVCVNDTLYHFSCSDLPFGGVGASGMGQYHGYDGFLTFSKAMPVLTKYAPAASDLIKPPYTGLTERLIRFIVR
ncbi:coniferyl-aldehyde dehydrogenase [Brucella melitensis bv. 1 str. 16M]|uniref:Coniferyl-aldehyde dehydrogenase n=1 Tax=Brucella melitensis biotype 1 (strain ATCC 23456 / CCUG 17765 / NCTC 10094 / 16M) TaxID=224914 RepID=Q8YDD6_BRUME|nr:coniferyl-aldehyde dehydrogenase [Brucella melitensis bv. 1 str. 16M]